MIDMKSNEEIILLGIAKGFESDENFDFMLLFAKFSSQSVNWPEKTGFSMYS